MWYRWFLGDGFDGGRVGELGIWCVRGHDRGLFAPLMAHEVRYVDEIWERPVLELVVEVSARSKVCVFEGE